MKLITWVDPPSAWCYVWSGAFGVCSATYAMSGGRGWVAGALYALYLRVVQA